MNYPGHVVQAGETDGAVVAAIVAALRAKGYAIDPAVTAYGPALRSGIKLFQSQHVDAAGRPLLADGKVGPLTWGALFDVRAALQAATGLAGAALGVATGQVGVMEQPPGSNSGPMVDQFLASVGLGPGYSWCMAFVHWCFQQAAADTGVANSFPKTGGCINAWNIVNRTAPARAITREQAIADPALVKPGFVFILDHGGGNGHTGFVKQAVSGALNTIEGNSNDNGSANGVGVFDLNRRSVMEKDLKGFLDFTA